MDNCRIKQVIGLRYDDLSVVKPIIEDIVNMLKDHPDIDQQQTLRVHFDEFAEYSLNCAILAFAKTKDWTSFLKIKEDVLFKIADIVARHGADFAYPTRVNISRIEKST